MGATSRRIGSLRLRALEAEAIVDGAASKAARPLADYFGSPREPQATKIKQARVTTTVDRF